MFAVVLHCNPSSLKPEDEFHLKIEQQGREEGGSEEEREGWREGGN